MPEPIRWSLDNSHLTISYTEAEADLRHHQPDCIAERTAWTHCLIKAKGREDIDVKHKDRAAQLWCENASLLTGTEWLYKIVHQKEFEKLRPDEFCDLVALEPITLL
jgi:type III restriction enzyme